MREGDSGSRETNHRSRRGSIAGLLLPIVAMANPPLVQLIVRIYGAQGVAPRNLAAARTTARAILRVAAIGVVWRRCDGTAQTTECDDVLDPREAIVRIVAGVTQIPANSLGYSLVNIQQRSGCLATVFFDRVEALAGRADANAGTLLGCAFGHELGHLLLGLRLDIHAHQRPLRHNLLQYSVTVPLGAGRDCGHRRL